MTSLGHILERATESGFDDKDPVELEITVGAAKYLLHLYSEEQRRNRLQSGEVVPAISPIEKVVTALALKSSELVDQENGGFELKIGRIAEIALQAMQ